MDKAVVEELESKHAALHALIEEEEHRTHPDEDLLHRLKKEKLRHNIIANSDCITLEADWKILIEKLQLNFLQSHKYHTNASQQKREPIKQENLSKLLVNN